MKLFLIRHGQTDWNLKGIIQGNHDTELNSTGIIQTEELSRNIKENNLEFSKIYCSRLKRAIKTAQILSKATNKDYIQVDGLQEMNLGKWEGLTWAEVKEKFPSEYEEWYMNRRYTKTPDGESYQDMLERVLVALRKIIEENTNNTVVITHGAVIACLQCYMTDTPFSESMKFSVDNSMIIEFDSEMFYDMR